MSMERSDSIKEIASALNKAQADMTGAKKAKDNPFFKSKYADLGAVINALKTPFADNGLSFSQFPMSEDGKAGVETMLMHVSGEWFLSRLLLPIKKNDPQGVGDAVTYARRYSLQSMAGIPAEDDDGNSNTNNAKPKAKAQTINENQITAIRSLFHSGMGEQQFLQAWNIPAMQDIQQASYDQVSSWLIQSKTQG